MGYEDFGKVAAVPTANMAAADNLAPVCRIEGYAV
jgi:hypothetical protein